jgi:hypothetical protein
MPDKPLSTRQFGQTLLPDFAEAHLDLQSVGNFLPLWGLQLGKISGQQFPKNLSKVTDPISPTSKSYLYPLTFCHVRCSASFLYSSKL